MMKKYLLLIITLSLFVIPTTVKAITINDLKAKISQLSKESQAQQSKINQKDQQINSTKIIVNQTIAKIDQTKNEISNANLAIERSNQEISKKSLEIKDLVKFMQVTNNESFYLEYIFGSDTMEDFVYRVAVTKHLAASNQEKINQLEVLIQETNKKKTELIALQDSLVSQQNELGKQLSTLGSEKSRMLEDYRDISLEIKQAQMMITTYEKAGCKPTQNISTCNALPPDTAFWRPITSGIITSEYGWRIHPVYGVRKLHVGMDMSGDRNLYSVAAGKVATTFYDKGSGNTVVIHHNINGRSYTSTYMHLSSIRVSKGQVVSKDTLVGIMGTTGNSTGVHLHLSIATCLRYQTCISYESWAAQNINPRSVINFPSGSGRWSNRTSRY